LTCLELVATRHIAAAVVWVLPPMPRYFLTAQRLGTKVVD